MSTTVRSPDQDALSTTAGTVALALGALAVAATIFLYALSLLPSFNPSNPVRIVGLAGLPVGALGAVLGYAIARVGPGKRRGLLGLVLAIVAVVATGVLIVVFGE
ncbi:hypothetical protein [Tessaracoccus oleiagri]|uniref:Major facilitator superfamily (MFS) profile domain-containing protein n=1 Tax=Tessaracoccus oleiagri TaxID=686624 RepID=A0A1G9HWF7_9ACTN|nr:hypothetical protein [Tessaracoccus oleiagri]SDL17337.1 hypothetical protein SAMN04488242_0577 [Tessaracoccus oleiagri]